MSTPARIHGFSPILGPDPTVLILGSMPSVRSLAEQQYYGHPRNRFWPLIGRLFDAGPDHPYAERCARLQSQGIAVWDVLASCERPGSLDAHIRRHSEQVNPITELLAANPSIQGVLFNGQAAAKTFQRHIGAIDIDCHSLPSTSPANAAWDLDSLSAVWRQALAATKTI